MPGVVRLGDMCSGHGCFPTRTNMSASWDVLIDGLPVVRVGDLWEPHGCSVCEPHDAIQASGSPNVLINGIPVARIGDSLSCGSTNLSGSGVTIIDES
jgi:uncharacterized Zn-binding protein involved in type VI secretion